MALINTGPNYTRTGDNVFTRWANRASFIPFGIGASISLVLGTIGTIVDAGGWLLRGKIGSAATAAAAGMVSTGLNSASGIFAPLSGVQWWLNVGSGVATGSSIGTHGRAATEAVIGSITGALGARPTVLRSYTAGVGSIGGQAQSGPGYYASRAAQERGMDPNQMWNNYRNGAGADHVAALEASRANGPNYRSV